MNNNDAQTTGSQRPNEDDVGEKLEEEVPPKEDSQDATFKEPAEETVEKTKKPLKSILKSDNSPHLLKRSGRVVLDDDTVGEKKSGKRLQRVETKFIRSEDFEEDLGIIDKKPKANPNRKPGFKISRSNSPTASVTISTNHVAHVNLSSDSARSPLHSSQLLTPVDHVERRFSLIDRFGRRKSTPEALINSGSSGTSGTSADKLRSSSDRQLRRKSNPEALIHQSGNSTERHHPKPRSNATRGRSNSATAFLELRRPKREKEKDKEEEENEKRKRQRKRQRQRQRQR